MKDYVITYKEKYRDGFVDHKVLWCGIDSFDAIALFWESFDEIDAKRISDVRVFGLIEIIHPTEKV